MSKEEACDCVLCMMVQAEAGPKEPRDDDDDDDDDDDESEAAAAPSDGLCECAQCRPLPIPVGDDLLTLLRQTNDSLITNYDEAGHYGMRLTAGLAAVPMPTDVEEILLQYAVDNWNASDRAVIAMCEVIAKLHASLGGGETPLPKCEPKTLDEARTILAATRAGRPRRKGHDMESRFKYVFDRLVSEKGR